MADGILRTFVSGSLLTACGLSCLMFFSVSALSAEALSQTQAQAQAVQQQQGQQAEQKSLSSEKKNYSYLPSQTFSNSAANTKKKEVSANTDALNVSLGLIFVLIMIFSLAWFMKKMGYSNLTGQGQLKIIATLNLGQKEKIALIQVGQQQILVGMTATQINTLHVLDELIEAVDDQTKTQTSEIGDKTFANKLSKFLNNPSTNTK